MTRVTVNVADTVRDLRDQVVRPVIAHLAHEGGIAALASTAAEQLLLGTAVVESWGHNLEQDGPGPALSPWQIEPATARDVLDRWLARHAPPPLRGAVGALRVEAFGAVEQLAGNLLLACAVARLRYWLAPDALPAAGDAAGLGAYWKRHYNTGLGKGDPAEFAARFRAHVVPLYG
ncbi:MAG: hypothetical protein AB7H93_23665 [Vicinamibacterales bacterium]